MTEEQEQSSEGRTLVEIQMLDGTRRRFWGNPWVTNRTLKTISGPGVSVVDSIQVWDAVETTKAAGAEALRDHGPVLAGMLDIAVDRAVGRSTLDLQRDIGGIEARLAAAEQTASGNHAEVFNVLATMVARLAALEALAAAVPHKRVLAAFPLDGKEVRIELHEKNASYRPLNGPAINMDVPGSDHEEFMHIVRDALTRADGVVTDLDGEVVEVRRYEHAHGHPTQVTGGKP